MDVSIHTDHMSLLFDKRKNDQFREDHTSLIIRSDKVTCPVRMTKQMIELLSSSLVVSPQVRRIIKSIYKERFSLYKRGQLHCH